MKDEKRKELAARLQKIGAILTGLELPGETILRAASNRLQQDGNDIDQLRTANTELLTALKALLACPTIAKGDFRDPDWGCEKTCEAEVMAQVAIAKAETTQ